jgi:DNA-binding IclR family transcriptional regulator
VLAVLSATPGTELSVSTIANRTLLPTATVSRTLQRLRRREGVDVRPGAKKGLWRMVAPVQTSIDELVGKQD